MTAETETALSGGSGLTLCFFKKHPLAERRIKLRNFNFTSNAFLIFTRPDNVAGLGGLQPEQAVL